MDGRMALAEGISLRLNTQTGSVEYTIRGEIGRGGSCIVYDASYRDRLGNQKLVRIKECYPQALRITRGPDQQLIVDSMDLSAFQTVRERLKEAYQRNHELFMIPPLTNRVTNTADLYESNGTIYIVSVYLNGCTFRENQGKTLHDGISLILGTAKALKHIHDAGYLYLDLKPDNILTVDGSLDLVQLFDFDSLLSMEQLSQAAASNDSGIPFLSCTRGYAPVEQQAGRLKQIGPHTDLYSLGAVLFYALWHRTPTAFDCETDTYDYSSIVYPDDRIQDGAFRACTEFLRKTLASYVCDRYQNADAAIEQLQIILALSDETVPWLRSTVIQKSPVFYGRRADLENLAAFLKENERHTVSLYGMGGIGKSSLVRQYLSETMQWDAFLWLYDQDSLADLLVDDMQLCISTVTRGREETAEEYLARKLKVFGQTAEKQRILVVIDNFTPAHLGQLHMLTQLGVTLLLISRERLPEGLYPDMRLSEMEENELEQMFAYYSHCDLSIEENARCFRTIAGIVGRHTLMTELIARQVARSFLDLPEAARILCEMGLSDLPPEKIDYIRDHSAFHGTMLKILDRLVQVDRFDERCRLLMKLLSLFELPGIETDLFRQIAGLVSLDEVNELISAGWLKSDQNCLYLHPVLQEYIRTWSWNEAMIQAAERMMRILYNLILSNGKRHDVNRQFCTDYEHFFRLLKAADQLLSHTDWVSEASQRLLFRILMDAPVDQDTTVMYRMLQLQENPRYLDDDSILRLYEMAAYYRARLYNPAEAIRLLEEMKRYLLKHPSIYYLSAYHRAMATFLHNSDKYGNLKKCLDHVDRAIAAARLSSHPEAKDQLAACLLDKATALLSVNRNRREAGKLIREAKTLIDRSGATDYETYQYNCTAAMYYAMKENEKMAESYLKKADEIAETARDSDLSVAEHLLEQNAEIFIVLKKYDRAEAAVVQAIALCERHPDEIQYREIRFDAYLFLGEIHARNGDCLKSEEAFLKAEEYVSDSPYQWTLPLCPKYIRGKARQERDRAHR